MAESSLIISSSDCDVDNKKSNNHFSNDDKFHDSSQTNPDNHVAEKTQDYTTKDNASSSKIPTHLAIMEENNSHEPDLSLPSLKKDDSGVDFEKSPASTSAQEGPILSDCSESVSESLTDSAACSYTNSVGDIKCDGKSKTSVSDEEDLPSLDVQDSELNDKEDSCKLPCNAEKMDLDSVNTEDINSESVEKEKLKPNLHSPVNSDDGGKAEMDYEDLDDNVEDDDDKNEETGSKKLSSSSSSSSSSSEEDEEEDVDDEEDEDEDESDMDYDSDKIPKHSWKAIYDLRSREFGHSTKTPPSIFREKVNSSLQMVQRLTLQYKMEYHNGCVNALNFNRIGEYLNINLLALFIVLFFPILIQIKQNTSTDLVPRASLEVDGKVCYCSGLIVLMVWCMEMTMDWVVLDERKSASFDCGHVGAPPFSQANRPQDLFFGSLVLILSISFAEPLSYGDVNTSASVVKRC
uniref:Uncharacterized protein n=1 Tax=Octopus bimaculoides TaxID=37653 RepID=A0A0L8G630_OCTBM